MAEKFKTRPIPWFGLSDLEHMVYNKDSTTSTPTPIEETTTNNSMSRQTNHTEILLQFARVPLISNADCITLYNGKKIFFWQEKICYEKFIIEHLVDYPQVQPSLIP